jgi:hypothetical protein
MSFLLKMTAFWDTAPCGLVKQTDVSEVGTAYIKKGDDVKMGP